MDDTAKRKARRKELVDQFLREIGVVPDELAASTLKYLDDWARQVILVTDQPSANWEKVILDLCRAVESHLESSLGQIQGLGFLSRKAPLGEKASDLEHYKFDDAVKQRLKVRGIKPGFVSSELPNLLYKLSKLRSQTNAAHGSVEIRTATVEDAHNARNLAGKVLRGCVSQHSR